MSRPRSFATASAWRRVRLASLLLATFAVLTLAVLAFAQETDAPPAASEPAAASEPSDVSDAAAERRVITIDSSGGTQSGNLRYGPIVYRHPDPLGIVATVSTLTIRGPEAELSGPPDTLLARAKGERTAVFSGGVVVDRGRLEADGPSLTYRETTGLGVLDGGVQVTIAPDDPDGDPTRVTAATAEFDVDTDRSVSRGTVVLVSGNQTAEADHLDYAEDQDLGVLSCETLCTIVRSSEDGDLIITAEEIRVLTQEERLWARGSVTVVDGDLVTTGDEVVYDDDAQLAEVSGSPARSVNERDGVTLESDRILQDIEFDYVEAIDASQASDVDLDTFRFPEERESTAP